MELAEVVEAGLMTEVTAHGSDTHLLQLQDRAREQTQRVREGGSERFNDNVRRHEAGTTALHGAFLVGGQGYPL